MAFVFDSTVCENLERGKNIPVDLPRFSVGWELGKKPARWKTF